MSQETMRPSEGGPFGGEPTHDALCLLRDVAILCNDDQPLHVTLCAALKRICEFNGCFAGHVYIKETGENRRLRRVASYGIDDEEPEALDSHRESALISLEQTLLDQNFDRLDSVWSSIEVTPAGSKQDGTVFFAVLIPLQAEDECLGVLHIFSEAEPELPDVVRQAIETIGLQLGRVVERKRLESAVSKASTTERARLGRNLHDTVCQELAGLSMTAERLNRELETESREYSELARTLMEGLRRSGSSVRDVVDGLLPVGLEVDALSKALKKLADHTSAGNGIRCTVESEADVSSIHVANELYFIAAESVANAVRHANPSAIILRLSNEGESLMLEIRDNGSGMPPRPQESPGHGLSVMKYRARALAGRLSITSGREGGTTIRCEVPHHVIDSHKQSEGREGDAEGMATPSD